MTMLTPLSRAAATAAAAAGACLAVPLYGVLALGSSDAFAAKAKATNPAKSAFEEQPIGGGSTTTSAHVGGSGGSIVRTIVGLAIVIAVIWGLSWILRQVKAGKEPSGPSGGLTSLAALTLSTGRSVHLVRAGSDYLLLGSAEQGVVPIHRYTEEEAREAGLMDVVEAGPVKRRGALLRPPTEDSPSSGAERSMTTRHGGHDPMRMPSPGPGTSLLDRMRELTVRR